MLPDAQGTAYHLTSKGIHWSSFYHDIRLILKSLSQYFFPYWPEKHFYLPLDITGRFIYIYARFSEYSIFTIFFLSPLLSRHDVAFDYLF